MAKLKCTAIKRVKCGSIVVTTLRLVGVGDMTFVKDVECSSIMPDFQEMLRMVRDTARA